MHHSVVIVNHEVGFTQAHKYSEKLSCQDESSGVAFGSLWTVSHGADSFGIHCYLS